MQSYEDPPIDSEQSSDSIENEGLIDFPSTNTSFEITPCEKHDDPTIMSSMDDVIITALKSLDSSQFPSAEKQDKMVGCDTSDSQHLEKLTDTSIDCQNPVQQDDVLAQRKPSSCSPNNSDSDKNINTSDLSITSIPPLLIACL